MKPSEPNGKRTPPPLEPPSPGHAVLVYALPGLGKSTLAAAHTALACDADTFLYAAVARGFPGLEPRAQLRAWRTLCRRRPWERSGDDLALWGGVRRAYIAPFIAAMRSGAYRLVLTSELSPPWVVSAYYGVERGRYLEHMRLAKRALDNGQSEAMNDRLEGYEPLTRLRAGTFLAERSEIQRLLGD
ncbi:MAG: hypothetical protein R3F39_08570 [Myxococcota bacterium]